MFLSYLEIPESGRFHLLKKAEFAMQRTLSCKETDALAIFDQFQSYNITLTQVDDLFIFCGTSVLLSYC